MPLPRILMHFCSPNMTLPARHGAARQSKNFLVVDNKTDNAAIEAAFEAFYRPRKDIGIVLINQHVQSLGLILLWPRGSANLSD